MGFFKAHIGTILVTHIITILTILSTSLRTFLRSLWTMAGILLRLPACGLCPLISYQVKLGTWKLLSFLAVRESCPGYGMISSQVTSQATQRELQRCLPQSIARDRGFTSIQNPRLVKPLFPATLFQVWLSYQGLNIAHQHV